MLFISKSAITVDTSVEIHECRKHFKSFTSIAITIDGKSQWLEEDVNKTELPYDCQKLFLAFLRQHVNKFNLLQLIYLFYYNKIGICRTELQTKWQITFRLKRFFSFFPPVHFQGSCDLISTVLSFLQSLGQQKNVR